MGVCSTEWGSSYLAWTYTVNLSSIDRSNQDLQGTNLENATLKGIDFSNATLTGMAYDGIVCSDCIFSMETVCPDGTHLTSEIACFN